MESRIKKNTGIFVALLALAIPLGMFTSFARAQAAAQRFVGTITAIAGDTLTIKTDSGEIHQVAVPSTAVIKQLAPGQKDLSAAQEIKLGDLASGDRVLVKLDPNATGN